MDLIQEKRSWPAGGEGDRRHGGDEYLRKFVFPGDSLNRSFWPINRLWPGIADFIEIFVKREKRFVRPARFDAEDGIDDIDVLFGKKDQSPDQLLLVRVGNPFISKNAFASV